MADIILLLILLWNVASNEVRFFDVVRNYTNFYCRTFPTFPSKLVTLEYSILYNITKINHHCGIGNCTVILDVYTSEHDKNFFMNCSVDPFGHLRNENLRTPLYPGTNLTDSQHIREIKENGHLSISYMLDCNYLPSVSDPIPCHYKPVTCDPSPNITNAIRINGSGLNGTYLATSQVEYQCLNESFLMEGNSTVTCLYSGQWYKVPKCLKRKGESKNKSTGKKYFSHREIESIMSLLQLL